MPKLTKAPVKPLPTGKAYCRKCQDAIPAINFYETTTPYLDTNGLLSVCKKHCGEIYNNYFEIYGTMDKALYFTCRDLDVCFNKEALNQAQSHIEKLLMGGKSADSVFGYYKSKLSSIGKKNGKVEAFRFKDSDDVKSQDDNDFIEVGSTESIDKDLLLFWGKGFDYDDYDYLENELSNWKQTHKCDNQAEVTLLKEICIKLLTITNKRAVKESVSTDLKELQDLMKTASVDPAKANTASAGKSHDAFGVWVKDIEQFTPAEWFKDQKKYKDMDEFLPYIKNYICRPIMNFLAGTRNFTVTDGIEADLDKIDDGDING